jgi:hypothetical protein
MADAGFRGTRRLPTWLRIAVSVAVYLVVFGLAHALVAAGVTPGVAYQLLVATVIFDARLLWTYFQSASARSGVTSESLELVA